MPTYVYETLPRPGRRVKRYEIVHSMKDAVLTKHPETGEPIRRLIMGGGELFVRAATIERPEPRAPKKPRWKKDRGHRHDGPSSHYDHHDH